MSRRHHGYWFSNQGIEVPDYTKYPLEQRFLIAEEVLDAEGYNVMYKDWDTGLEDFSVQAGGANLGTYYTRRVGEYEWTLENWKMRYRPAGTSGGTAYADYVPTQAVVDAANIGATVFEVETRDGLYSFADVATTLPTYKYMTGVNVYESRTDWDAKEAGRNQFDKNTVIEKFKTVGTDFVADENVSSFVLVFASGSVDPNNGGMTISFDTLPADTIDITYSYMPIEAGGTVSGPGGTSELVFTQVANGRWSARVETGGYVASALLVINGIYTYEQLKTLGFMLEQGKNDNPSYIQGASDFIIDGWDIPLVEDWAQLFAMSGDLHWNEVINSLFVSSSSDVAYGGANIGQDKLGARITPSGHRQNQKDGNFFDYGRSAYFATRLIPNVLEDYTVFITNNSSSTGGLGHICVDKGTINLGSYSTKFWLRSIRMCRRLTDEELGYKLYVDEANDKIHVVAHSATTPAVPPTGLDESNELPKGILRGLALRFMDSTGTQIAKSLTWLQAEVDKTKDGGEYGWVGFHDEE